LYPLLVSHLYSFVADHLVKAYNRANLNFKKSNFYSLVSTKNGAVLYTGERQVVALFQDCIFNNTLAAYGGVFYIDFQGSVSLTRCTLKYNGAILGK